MVEHGLPEILLDPESIGWIETITRRKIKVRTAQIVWLRLTPNEDADPESSGESVLAIETTSGANCYVPVRSIVRIDRKPS